MPKYTEKPIPPIRREMLLKSFSRAEVSSFMVALFSEAVANPPDGSNDSGVTFWKGFAAEALGTTRSPRLDRIEKQLFAAGREVCRRGGVVPEHVLRPIYGKVSSEQFLALVARRGE